MLKIVEVAKAWIRASNPTPEQEAVALYRIKVCDECPSKKHITQFDSYVCGECGCPLNKKIFSPQPGPKACPLGKWKF
jgi:hypothetical protein